MMEGKFGSFHAVVCHVCKYHPNLSLGSEPLKRCQGCKLIAYCSVGHQRKHWSEHKSFCKAISKLTEGMSASYIFANATYHTSQIEWCQYRTNLKRLCEIMLQRSLSTCEAESIYFPRLCFVCHSFDQGSLIDCSNCLSVSYCSNEHLMEDAQFHKKSCDKLKLCFDLDLSALHDSLPDIRFSFTENHLCHSSDEFCSKLLSFTTSKKFSNHPLSVTVYLTVFSCPFTFIYSVFQVGLHLSEELVAHIVGASSYETEHLDMWDIVFHWLPNLISLQLILIGPDVLTTSNITLCSRCEQSGHKLTLEFYPCLFYHNYVDSSNYIKPDIIIMFNCGLSEFIEGANDTWQNSIPSIVTSDCPVVLTSFTGTEAENDLKRLVDSSDKMCVLIQSEKNSFSSQRPLRDWEQFVAHSENLVFYHNAFISVLVPKLNAA